ncbi:hypothetical protein [Paenibacillus barengoltzii]|uniref:hypothetical protein n=1 Tax=Paenibacillus barengoltzii TaxID=343517 RepID=UPI000FD990BC|nr:hypothetical protein [Paenibacillus barengoltzii]
MKIIKSRTNKSTVEALNLLEAATEKLFPAQDYVNNSLVYGYLTNNKKDWLFLTSNSNFQVELLNENDAKTRFNIGEIRKTSPIQELSPTIIKQCYESSHIVNTRLLVDKLASYISEFVYLDDDRLYDFLAIWIMGTYHFRCFTYYPYIWLNAEKGSGKSTLLTLLSKLSFNGLLLDAASSTASLYRLIETSSPTLFIDEFEMLEKTKATDLGSILRAGFHTDSKLAKSKRNNDDFEPEMFHVYCPKALASINEIQDTLKERCITIRMLKKPKNVERRKFYPNEEKKSIQKLKEMLYLYGLTHASEISAKYVGRSWNITLPETITDREKDLWFPLTTMAFHIDLEYATSYTDELHDLMNKSSEERKYDNYLEHDGTKLIIFLYRLVTRVRPDIEKDNYSWYSNDSIYQFYADHQNRDISEHVNKNTLGKKLSKLNLQQKTMNYGKTKRYYQLDTDVINQLAERYDIKDEYLEM